LSVIAESGPALYDRVVLVAGVVGLVFLAVAVVAFVWLHLAGTGLSPLQAAVSRYGISPAKQGYRVLTISLGLGGASVAVGVSRAVSGPGTDAVVTALALFAVARALISWFPMDQTGESSTHGRIHGLLALVAFAGIAYASIRLGKVLRQHQPWSALSSVSLDLGWVMLADLVAFAASRIAIDLRKYFGALERLFYVAFMGWLGVVAVFCVVQPHH